MKFLVDVCAGRRLAEWLRARGHEAAEVRQRASNMEDDDILAWAYAEGRVVVTVDKDFGALAVALEQPHHGIIRLPDVSAVQRQHLIEQVLAKHQSDLEDGAIVTVTRTRIRVRMR
ncbi:MAG: hypothetical protein FJ272_05490 [Planctomycetes bacterium]|nr:hypothetical protein [Planctomycetota bacterium]